MKLVFYLFFCLFSSIVAAASPLKEGQLLPRSFGLSSSPQYIALKKRNDSAQHKCEQEEHEEEEEEDELECEEVESLNETEEDCEEINDPFAENDSGSGNNGTGTTNTTDPSTNGTFTNVDPNYGQFSAASHLVPVGWSMLLVMFSLLAMA
jgi:hypothetical protein